MTDIVQALAALEADPTQSDAISRVAAQAKQAAQSGPEGAAAGLTALQEFLKRCRERGDFELWLTGANALLGSGLLDADKTAKTDFLVEKSRVFSDELLRDADAEEALKQALAVDPDHEGAQDAQSDLEMLREKWQQVVKKNLDDAKASTARQLTT